MTPADFTEWDLPTWNQRLFDAVFAAKDGVSLPVRRINVAPSFLAAVAGVDSRGRESVRDALLTQLRDQFPRGRGIFDRLRALRGWRREEEIPPFFVNLYLSLIAASASEETHDEGNLRVRMALLLDLPAHVNPVTYDLPLMWEDLEEWTASSPASRRGYRPLELPNPGIGNIIGYAKRLVFPRFHDMSWLSRVVTESGVGVDSPISAILQEVGRVRDHFSGTFRKEFDRFRKLARAGDPSCLSILFWDAFTEVTWETHLSRARSRPRCDLGMEVPDIWNPQAVLLLPHGFDGSGLNGRAALLDRSAAHDGVLIADDGWSLLRSRDHPWRRVLPKRLDTLIEAGCLPFGPGDEVHWDVRSTLPWSGPVWLMVSQRKVVGVRRALTEGGVTATPNPIGDAGGWYLLGRLDYHRDSAQRILQALPSDLRRLLDPEVPDAQIHLRDAIRLPDGILALRPRLPMIRAEGADAVLLGPIDGTTAIGLSPSTDGLFVIPAESQRLTAGDYRATAHSKGRIRASRIVHLIQTYTGEIAPLLPSDPGRWLMEGARGQLVSLLDPEAIRAEGVDAEFLARLQAALPLGKEPVTAQWHPLTEIPHEWADLFEVLVAWSSRREGLGWDEVARLVRNGLGVEERLAHQAIDVLLDNEIIDRLYNRLWRGSLFFTRRPMSRMARTEAGWECRVSGATSRLWRNRLRAIAESHGLTPEIAVLGDLAGVGVIRVLGESLDHLEPMLDELGIDRAEQIEFPQPADLLGERVPDSFSVGLETAYFDWARLAFAESRASPLDKAGWTLERRTFETQQAAYVLSHRERHIWVSRSRRWAGFLAGLIGGTRFWQVGNSGVVTTKWPLPIALARGALWQGGGVAGSNWQKGERCWCYAFASAEHAKHFLAPWLDDDRKDRAEDSAIGLWLQALGLTRGAPSEEVLKDWYREA